MKNLPFQQEFKISLPTGTGQKSTLSLSPTGDLQLVDGKEKLTIQALRAIINDDIVNYGLINARGNVHRIVSSWVESALKQLKDAQTDEVSKSDVSFSGFHVWRRAAGTTDQFSRISKTLVGWKFVDSRLSNGTSYEYGITKNYENTFNTSFVDRFVATPYRSIALRNDLIIGAHSIAFPGDKQVTFYVDYNRRFKASELLEDVHRIESSVDDEDPRRFLIKIIMKNYFGDFVSLSSGRLTNG